MVWLSQQKIEDFEKAKKKIDQKYPNDNIWQKLFYNAVGNFILGISDTVPYTIRSYHVTYSHARMLILYIDAKSQNIPPSDMAEFINKSEKKFWNPLTGKPFKWNSESKSIYFVRPNSDGGRREIFY